MQTIIVGYSCSNLWVYPSLLVLECSPSLMNPCVLNWSKFVFSCHFPIFVCYTCCCCRWTCCVGSNIICSPTYLGVGGDAHAICDRSIDVFISYRRSTGSQLARCLDTFELCIYSTKGTTNNENAQICEIKLYIYDNSLLKIWHLYR